jgi:hypothetical protein
LEEGDDLGEIDGEKVLGYYEAQTNTISLDAVLNNSSHPLHWKKTFTFWHELGHALLHGEWMRRNPGSCPDSQLITVESDISASTTKRLEQQANLFAARAGAPQWFLNFVLESTFRLTRPFRYIGPGTYWLDVWGCARLRTVSSFEDFCRNISYQVRHRFGGMPIESLTYRVMESEWVIDVSEEIQSSEQSFRAYRSAPFPVGESFAPV